MTQVVELPLWLFVLIVLFAAVTFASHFLFPSVRWFFRRRLEKAVEQLNTRLTRPIEPFKLARRYDMIQRLIYDPEVTREIVTYAKHHKVPENVGFEKARSYAREIVPSFSAFTYFSFGIRVARLLATALYTVRTGARNDEIITAVPKEATVVFVMNHRSNMDYVLVTYLAGHASALSYAVGEWARVWPLSRLIKSMGAYFIRRRSGGTLYRAVLSRYVEMATAGGVTQAIFPEGGLSLNGSLRPPKLGLLSYVLDGYEPEGRDVVFVPVAINYDRVLEDTILIEADARGDRRFGTRISVVIGFVFRKIGQKIRGTYTRFGSAAVVFGEPLSLRAFGPDRPVSELADTLMTRIGETMPVLFVPLCASALRNGGGQITDTEMTSWVTRNATDLSDRIPGFAELSIADATTEACRLMVSQGLIEKTPGGWRTVLDRESRVAFYANSISHLVSAPAATAKELSAPAKS